jgi:hypothetical protein
MRDRDDLPRAAVEVPDERLVAGLARRGVGVADRPDVALADGRGLEERARDYAPADPRESAIDASNPAK